MKTILTSFVAISAAIPFIASPPAMAASCPDILREAEKAYNQFQEADARGDEGDMAKYYVRFDFKIKLAQKSGCM